MYFNSTRRFRSKRGSIVIEAWSLAAMLVGSTLFFPMLTGCGDPGPSRQAVRGTVTVDGAPASELTIVFQPEQPGQSGAVASVIDGSFALDANSGPSTGQQHVVFVAEEPDLEEYERRRLAGEQTFSGMKLHPKFTRPGALSVNIAQQGENDFQFELTSQSHRSRSPRR